MDAKQVLLYATDQDIINILYKLGSDISDRSNEEYIIFNTSVCHGGENYKLYYYRNTKSFYCYSGCGAIRDIFDLIKQSLNISFEESVKYVINELGLNTKVAKRGFPTNRNIENKKQNLNDIELEILSPIEKPYLYYAYPDIPIIQWLKNDISKEAMQTFNIRYCTKSNAAIIPHFNIKHETVGIRVRAFNQEEIENYGKYHPLYYGGEGYAHPLGKNLYGLHKTKEAIKKYKKVVIGESEKFVLQFETYYGENNISVALCGSSFSKYQMKMLLDLGVEEFILALDKEYETIEDEIVYLKKIYKKVKILLDNNIKVTLIWDGINGLLGYKDSPTDKGKETYEKLVKNRREIKETMNEKIQTETTI